MKINQKNNLVEKLAGFFVIISGRCGGVNERILPLEAGAFLFLGDV